MSAADTSGRLLRLLSLLQAHRAWSGQDLADRLGVTTRTVRRDVERLRALGYPVNAEQGQAGYRLGSGASLPPLLLNDSEAVAVAIGLRTAASSSVSGIEESALSALRTLEQVLPSRLRHRVSTLSQATTRTDATAPSVPADVLVQIAETITRRETLRFDYVNAREQTHRHEVEPLRLVSWGRRWYLVGWSPRREDWRTYRVDRMTPRIPNGPRFAPREPPDGDVVAYLSRQLSHQTWPYRATVRLHAGIEEMSQRVWPGLGALEAEDTTCLLHVGAGTHQDLAWLVLALDVDFTILEAPPELASILAAVGARCLAAGHAPRAAT